MEKIVIGLLIFLVVCMIFYVQYNANKSVETFEDTQYKKCYLTECLKDEQKIKDSCSENLGLPESDFSVVDKSSSKFGTKTGEVDWKKKWNDRNCNDKITKRKDTNKCDDGKNRGLCVSNSYIPSPSQYSGAELKVELCIADPNGGKYESLEEFIKNNETNIATTIQCSAPDNIGNPDYKDKGFIQNKDGSDKFIMGKKAGDSIYMLYNSPSDDWSYLLRQNCLVNEKGQGFGDVFEKRSEEERADISDGIAKINKAIPKFHSPSYLTRPTYK